MIHFRRAFTFPELMLGMVISMMTLGALAALATAVGQNWDQSSSAVWTNPDKTPTRTVVWPITGRLQLLVKRARYFGWVGSKSDGTGAAVFLWMNDDNGDGKMQLGEIALVDYDSAARAITKYQVPSNASNAGNDQLYSSISAETKVAEFKKLANVLPSAQVMQRDVKRLVPVAHNLTDTATRASLEYVMEVDNGATTGCEYGTATLRAPGVQPP